MGFLGAIELLFEWKVVPASKSYQEIVESSGQHDFDAIQATTKGEHSQASHRECKGSVTF